MKLVVIMFLMTMTSLKVFKKIVQRQIFNCKNIVDGKIFNCKMTEEPTMATAEETAQRVYAKRLAADKVRKESVPRNHKNSKKTGLRLIEKVRKESVPRNLKNSKKTGLRLKNAKSRS